MRKQYDKLTTTIRRPWLSEIIAGTKKIEYRQIKPYWTKRLRVPNKTCFHDGLGRALPSRHQKLNFGANWEGSGVAA